MPRPLLLLLLATACARPPPAPDGLDDSARYLVRHFWDDDATFEAGVRGLLTWFERGNPLDPDQPSGRELVGLAPDSDGNTDAFTVADLAPEDIALLPLAAELVIDPQEGELAPRDLSAANGVVAVAEMACGLEEALALLLRPDQDRVFPNEWEAYERTYLGSPEALADAVSSGDVTSIVGLDPYREGFDIEPYEDTVLLTVNQVDPTPLVGIDFGAYTSLVEFRRGVYDVDLGEGTESVRAFGRLHYIREAVWAPRGSNALLQSFSIELDAELAGGRTLRVIAVWGDFVSPVGGSETVLAQRLAVKKARESSALLSSVCAGETEVASD